jgi:micrococcal nuclease
MVNRRYTLVAGTLLMIGAGVWSCATSPPPSPAEPPPPAIEPRPTQAPTAVDTPTLGDEQPVLVGTVIRVSDGDTIKVQLSSGPISVRFHSIDSPEKNQPWGMEAQAALARRIDGQEVALDVATQDRYERLVATVYLGDENMNGWMVRQGHAWAYRDYLKDAVYCDWEAEARSSRRGLWAQATSNWKSPWEWRRAERTDGQVFTDYSRETVVNCVAASRSPRKNRVESASRGPAPAAATASPG